MVTKRLIVDRETLVLLGFLVSLTSSVVLAIYFISLIFIYTDVVGYVKALVLIETRSKITPVLGVAVSSIESLKFLVIIALCILILMKLQIVLPEDKEKVKRITFFVLIYSVYSVVTSLIFSSFPITALAKIFSFTLVFLSIILGVSSTYMKYDWIKFFIRIQIPIFIVSLLVLPLNQFRIRNASFHGIFNHPNMLGIMSAIFFTALLYQVKRNKNKKYYLVFLCLTLLFIYLSKSRTGMFSSVIVLGFYLLSISQKKTNIKLIVIGLVLIIFALSVFLLYPKWIDDIYEVAQRFIYKSSDSGILSSRLNQMETYLNRFFINPLFGTGFGVPYIPNYRIFSLSFNAIVEPGNLVIAVMAYSGIMGSIIFIILLSYLFIESRGTNKILFLITIFVSLGEMVFFSVNNVGIYLYLLIGVSIFQVSKYKTLSPSLIQ